MYKIVGMGDTSPDVIARVQASMPKCFDPEFQECELHPNTSAYPNCKEIMDLRENDPDTYNKIYDTVPYCPNPDTDYSMTMIHAVMIGGGVVLGLLIGKLLFQ